MKKLINPIWPLLVLCLLLQTNVRAQSEAAQGEVFFNYGSVSGGISQYYYSSFTVGQPVVGPYFGSDYQGALGFWSRFLVAPAPPITTASEGDFPDRILLNWEVDPLSPASDMGFKIYRDGAFLASVDPATLQFIDFNVIPGNFYNYSVRGVNSFGDGYLGEAVGFVNPNGTVTGQVTTINDNPVAGVQVTLEPTLGTSVAFNGVDEHIRIPYNSNYTAANMTVSCWVKKGASPDKLIIDLGKASNQNWWLSSTSTGVEIGIGNGGSQIFDLPFDTLPNDWHQVAFTYNGADLNAYLDGELKGTMAATMTTGEQHLYLGANPDIPNSNYDGILDDLRIYSRQLSQSEIIRTMNATVPATANGLVAYWKFDEGLGYKTFDLGVNQLDGYLTGVTFSDDRPNVLNAGVTDASGYYLIEGINYGGGQVFTAKPSKDFNFNNALEFNASNQQYATITDFMPADTGTIEVWFKPSSLSNNQTILAQGSDFDLSLSGTDIVLSFGSASAQTIGTITETNYTHVAISYALNAGTPNVTTYVNGENPIDFSTSMSWDSITWNIGRNTSESNYFTGLIDEIVFFKNARSQYDIQQDAAAVDITDLNILTYFSMNESTGTTLSDQSPNNRGTGEINGASWTSVSANPHVEPHEFNPGTRIVTLGPDNTSTDNVNFEDISTVAVSGYVRYANTDCFAEGVEILVNGQTNLPPIYTDANGFFVADFEPGTSFELSPSLEGHQFNPAFWTITNIVVPKAGIVFNDQTKRNVEGIVAGGLCHKSIIPESGSGNVRVILKSTNNCYVDSIDIDNPSGDFEFKKVPPIDFVVSVQHSDAIIHQSFIDQGAPQIDLSERDTTLEFIYRAPLVVETTAIDTNACGEPMIEQFNRYRVDITVFEEYYNNQRCLVDSVDLVIDNRLDTEPTIDTTYKANTFKHLFYAGPPHIVYPYTKSVTIKAQSPYDDRFAVDTLTAVVIGKSERQSEFTTTSPDLPLMILRDPPGDGSYSYIESGTEKCQHYSFLREDTEGQGAQVNVSLGPDFSSGFGYEIETNVVLDASAGINVATSYTTEMEQQLCITSTSTLATKDDDLIVGSEMGGDLYMGGAMNLIFGITDALTYNDTTCTYDLNEEVFIRPDGFATNYLYSETHIKNVIIPDLLNNILDTVSANLWLQVIQRNEETKAQAVFEQNLSFDGGVVYEYTQQTQTSNSTTLDFSVDVDYDFALEAGLIVGGVGTTQEHTLNMGYKMGSSTTTSQTSSSEVGYHLEDNDNGDNFSINVLNDKTFGTPVFTTVSGQSSCPHEPGTQNRDQVSLEVAQSAMVNVPETEPAVFDFTVANLSPSEDTRVYMLALDAATNPDGAVVKINGQPTTDPIAFSLAYLESVPVTVTVEKGPIEYDYEDLEIIFYAECERDRAVNDLGVPTDSLFEVHIPISAYFIESCSDVEIAFPLPDWVVTPANGDSVAITLNSYDLDDTDMELLRVQYREIDGNGAWVNITEVEKDSLGAISETIYWDISALADGPYEIRALSQCTGLLPIGLSSVIPGKLERVPPALLGVPEPADGILHAADQIYIEFSEEIDCAAMLANVLDHVSLINTEANTLLNFDVSCIDNRIYIVPTDQNEFIENKILRAEVNGIEDLAGNAIPEPINWEFLVDRNPLKWADGDIDDIKYVDESWLVTRTIQNVGGQTVGYTLEDVPAWIIPSTQSGEVAAGDTEVIVFTVSDQIANGQYTGTILLHSTNGMGDEPLNLDLDVICHPPEWSVDPSAYWYNMSFTVELDIEGEISNDENDIVAAFIDGELRGIAHVEYEAAPTIERYLAYLTVYSNELDEGEISFQIWDASTCLLYGSILETYTFTNDASEGEPNNPDVLHTQNIVLREIPVYNGWNWISFNLDMPDKAINTVLESLDHPENCYIKDQVVFADYSDSLDAWSGSLIDMSYTTFYKFRGTQNDTISLLGHPIDPDTVNISLHENWNWIGYIPQQGRTVDEALASLSPLNGDLIKGQTSFAQYVAGVGWIGSLNFMEAPNGYMLKISNADTLEHLVGNDPEFNFALNNDDVIRNNGSIGAAVRSNVWDINPAAFEHSMTLVTTVEKDAFNLLKEGDEVAAFVNGEVRGVGQPIYIEPLDIYMLFLTTYANGNDETLTFKYYDVSTTEIHEIVEVMPFVANENHGSVDEPGVLTLATTTSAIDVEIPLVMKVMPNPFNDETNINFVLPTADEINLKVIDMLGNVVRQKTLQLGAGMHTVKLKANEANQPELSNGVYFISLEGKSGKASEQVLLVK